MRGKRWLVLLPLLLLLIGCSSKAKPNQNNHSTASGKFNGVTLDVSRRHYQVATLRKFINLVAANHGQFIQLHLTDDRDFAIENQTVGQTLNNATKKNGVWRNKKTHQAFYSKGQIRDLLAIAKKKGVTLIPEIDTPAHVNGLINTMKANGKSKLAKQLSWQSQSYGDELHLNQASISFIEKVDNEVGKEFVDQTNARFHLGGDEFTDRLSKNPAYVTYLNATSQNVEKMGFIPEAWNDGFLNSELGEINRHIQVTYWNWTADQAGELGAQRKKAWASMPKLISHHFKVFNYNDYYLYFNINRDNLKPRNVRYMVKDMKQYWKPTLWHTDHVTKLKSLHGIVGSSASIWGDSTASFSDQKIYQSSVQFIKAFMVLARKPA
ncbi:lacto-N-biosidase [Lentilactobacillus fungorum]|uniref:Lacto-N-biosidase n=1 Tax=Lentilactobacillus fungorum TaxID=2201250 RepID=A0ABQ3W0V6_9LACO|nr:family 20 glycosylhydrolase [Lentilactobacillus fungorum]GHP13314.1 lacto-N-biosidase [Lentilactobacillus fungorum]